MLRNVINTEEFNSEYIENEFRTEFNNFFNVELNEVEVENVNGTEVRVEVIVITDFTDIDEFDVSIDEFNNQMLVEYLHEVDAMIDRIYGF